MEDRQLQQAIISKNVEAVKQILTERPSAIEGKDDSGIPYSFLAAKTGSLPLVQYIVEYSRASLDVRDKDNRTILHAGTESGNCQLAAYLTERCGLSPMTGDKNLITPFEIAAARGDREILSYFEKICGAPYEEMYHNPIRSGMFPDPSVVRVGEDYYMVNSSFVFFPCIPISHSRDLIHWNIIGYAITNAETAALDELEGGRGYWAPDISWHKGRFYITATYRMNDGGPVCRRQIVTWSEKPEGPYCKPVFIEEDGIDPSLFWEDDGRCYMLLNRGARILELSPATMEQISPASLLYYGDQKRAPEGPHLLKYLGYYYLFLAEGGTGMGHRITVSRSRTLMGVYEPCPYNPIMRQTDEQAGIQRCGHGKPVQTQKGEWYMVYLCGRLLEGAYTMLGRETAIDPITWTGDGWPIVNGLKGPSVLQIRPNLPRWNAAEEAFPGYAQGNGVESPLRYAQGNGAEIRDEFDGTRLGLNWMTSRPPLEGGVTLKDGCLCILGSEEPLSSVKSRNMVLRRQTAFYFQAETCLVLRDPASWPAVGQDCGLLFYYDENTWLKFGLFGTEQGLVIGTEEHVLDQNRMTDSVEVVGQIGSQELCRLYLKVETCGLKRVFFWKTEEVKEWQQAAVLEAVDYLCDEAVNIGKRFTGAMAGLYACAGDRELTGKRFSGKFEYFLYQDMQTYV